MTGVAATAASGLRKPVGRSTRQRPESDASPREHRVRRSDEPAQGAAATPRGGQGLDDAELRTRRRSKALRSAAPEQGPETSGNANRWFEARVLDGERAWGRGDAVRLSARGKLRRVERHEEGNTPGITPGPEVGRRLAGGRRRGIGAPSRSTRRWQHQRGPRRSGPGERCGHPGEGASAGRPESTRIRPGRRGSRPDAPGPGGNTGSEAHRSRTAV